MGKIIDLSGQKIGRLTVIELIELDKWGQAKWLCKCDCGNFTSVKSGNLRNGHTQSCGCLHKEKTSKSNTKHGKRRTRLYRIFYHMKDRCYRESDKRYKDYGGRGITICQEWLNDFRAFYDWAMANGYREDLTIDRINVNGNYEPSNCRWSTCEEQAKNKRSNRLITIKNETLPLDLWLDRVNMKKGTFYSRIKRGWSEEKAILTPVAVVK